ncbi:NADH dehydrogenase ubiquinone 1 beta subcomplex subunit 9 [Spathaspora sp. JA1]|nr:NADH dehydrogenase ubiquinone 1 beta subcomplex subunit 9 [Spathaspora sp. JA1]
MTAILPFTEANSKRIASLFRQSLRLAWSHSAKFEAYRNATIQIRQQFEANKDIRDPNQLEEVIEKTNAKLYEWRHPDPIIPPSRPGGTKYERNLKNPPEPMVPGDW